MTRGKKLIGFLGLAASLAACSAPAEKAAPAPAASVLPEWTKEQKMEMGRQHKSAADLYRALRDQAKGGQKLAWNAMPDWSGLYSRPAINNFTFDPAQPEGG